MEVIIGLCILAILTASANYAGSRQLRPRSRYEPIPKPPYSISRTYGGELTDAVMEIERKRKGRQE